LKCWAIGNNSGCEWGMSGEGVYFTGLNVSGIAMDKEDLQERQVLYNSHARYLVPICAHQQCKKALSSVSAMLFLVHIHK
jgi:hypothetical protein